MIYKTIKFITVLAEPPGFAHINLVGLPDSDVTKYSGIYF